MYNIVSTPDISLLHLQFILTNTICPHLYALVVHHSSQSENPSAYVNEYSVIVKLLFSGQTCNPLTIKKERKLRMLNMNYIGDRTIYPVEFKTISDNVVQLKGDFPLLTNGFTLSRSDQEDNWDYSGYTTVYHKTEGSVQFSNDGSIYILPETIPEPGVPDFEPSEPTLEELEAMEQKRKEAAAIPTNAELSAAMMELAENISDIDDAVAEIGSMI